MKPTWDEFFAEQRATGCLADIEAKVRGLRWMKPLVVDGAEPIQPPAVFPPAADVFRAFELTPLHEVRVVILGQDPYHGPGQAHGLAFSVPPRVVAPPSLRNILRELADDLAGPDFGFRLDARSVLAANDLTPWARQGVLLLNTALTVLEGEPRSHLQPWRPFTDAVVRHLVSGVLPALLPIFVLWGKPARETLERAVGTLRPVRDLDGVLRAQNTFAVASAHPSPLSAKSGFFGSRPFSKVNRVLELFDQPPIDWRLP